MTETFATAQDAEDAFYDAIEEGNAERMASVWGGAPDIACLLPMQPLFHGDEARDLWAPMFSQGGSLDLQVRHIRWVELSDLAIHYVTEWIKPPTGQRAPPPLYATNIFRKGPAGWNLLLHQCSPTPPPPGAMGGQTPA